MDRTAPDLIKHRDICFCRLHPDPRQPHTAILLLNGVDGILAVHLGDNDCVQVSYDLSRICLRIIDDALIELGFHLDNSLLTKLKRALFYYTEEVQCANYGGCENLRLHTRDVFIHRYEHLPHGCRDHRPEYWRRYL